MSPVQINPAVTHIFPVQNCTIPFARPTQFLLPVTPALWFALMPKKNQPFTPSGLRTSTKTIVIFHSLNSSPTKAPSTPASPDDSPASFLQPNKLSSTAFDDVAPSLPTGLQFLILLPDDDHPVTTKELSPFNSLSSDLQPLHLRFNLSYFCPDQSTFRVQNRQEHYTNRAQRIK